jgi:DNA primase
MISSYQAGVENVVAIKGTALTETQCRLLKRYCENIILATDTDKAGDEAARRGIEIADSLGFNVRVAIVKGAKDPDELAQKKPEAWKKTVEEAIPVYDFYLQSAMERIGFETAVQKKELGGELLPIYARITDELVKSHYLRALAKKIGVSEEALYTQLEKVETEPTPLRVRREEIARKTAEPSVRPRREVLEEYLLALVFQVDKVEILTKPRTSKMIKTPGYQRILKRLKDFFKKRKRFKSERFAEMLPAELLGIFNSLYLIDFGERLEDEEWWEKELKKILLEIEKEVLKGQLKESSEKLGELEKEGKTRELKRAEKEFQEILSRLNELTKE